MYQILYKTERCGGLVVKVFIRHTEVPGSIPYTSTMCEAHLHRRDIAGINIAKSGGKFNSSYILLCRKA